VGQFEGRWASKGGVSLDSERKSVTKHSGKILRGFTSTEQVTLTVSKDPENSVTVLRCEGCKALNTDYSVGLFGKCWSCGGHRLTGGSPTFWEEHWLLRRMDIVSFNFRSWLRTGEWGRGRTVRRALWQAFLRLPHTVFYQVVAPWDFYYRKVAAMLRHEEVA
jgi:hypothetical protein